MELISSWELDFNRSVFVVGGTVIPSGTWPTDSDIGWPPPFFTLSPFFFLPTTLPPPSPTTAPSGLMPAWAQAAWISLFSGMLVVAIGGNSIVMWIVMAHRRMRSVTNYFLVNLSVADLLMAVLNCLFNFIYMLHNDWIFGIRYCKLSNFIANVTVAASVFTLTGISFDRYQAIVWPMKPRMSKTWSLVMIGIIWLTGMALAIPCLLYSSTITYKYRGRVKTACILIWPDGKPDVSYMDFVYQVLFFVVTYMVPMLGMTCFYTAMGRVLWGSESIGELTQRQLESIRSKRKVVKMFILVIVIFGICWLPYQTYFIYTHFNPGVLYKKYIQHVYLGFYWLAMANAMVNPIIYYWMNAKFRSYFNAAICGWRTCITRKNSKNLAVDSPQLVDRHSNSGSRSRSGIAEEYKEINNQSTQTYDTRFSVNQQLMNRQLVTTMEPETLHLIAGHCREQLPRKERQQTGNQRVVRFTSDKMGKNQHYTSTTTKIENQHPNSCCIHSTMEEKPHTYMTTSRL